MANSTALLVLVARWAKQLKRAPKLIAVTIDHGLRPEGAREAAAVKRLARRLGVAHRILRWRGTKPKTGLQEAARSVRYRLLGQAAAKAGCAHILTAHTLDDQAETVLFRLARGSGIVGLAGMAHVSPLPMGADQIAFSVAAAVAHSQSATARNIAGRRYFPQRGSEQPRSTLYPLAAAGNNAASGARRIKRSRAVAISGAHAASGPGH